MRFPRNCKAFRGQLDVAPWAALFFVLVLFFTLHTSLFFVPGVRIELPKVQGTELAGVTNASVSVMVDRDSRIFYEHQLVVDMNALKRRLEAAVRASKSGLTLTIQADRQLDVQRVVELKRLAAEAGIKDMILAGRPLLGEPRGGSK